MADSIRISIITPVYNGERYLEETIQSVLNQTYANIEHIVVDGVSEDNTLDIINKYREKIAKVIVERDRSMYEAINRGIAIASGDYLLVLNSDDCLADNKTIKKVADYVARYPNYLAYYGDIFKREGRKLTKRKVFQISKQNLLHTQHCTLIPHPALFVDRMKSLELVGVYDLSYRYASDFDYILRLLESGPVKHMRLFVSIFRIHPDSISASGKLDQERLAILGKYQKDHPQWLKSLLYLLIWSRYKILNYIANKR
ncbi:glycosyltransferase family 2 protein [Persicitalea jodogahamensis]|uniref:Glycosyl transferase n=1 Tax=Persicitalea jodogahamensis TaxID=402147 RepID=A0A8J3D698_9BACT|nr:glycosyltransferase family 2 protein [Persicitalea jodogahamensis]GHB59219.1 glycosyl transferase [Persicitalea jodogahamensis]